MYEADAAAVMYVENIPYVKAPCMIVFVTRSAFAVIVA
jgi:hypothetical protein